MSPQANPPTLQALYDLYPDELFTYRRILKAERDGVITPTEAQLLRCNKEPV